MKNIVVFASGSGSNAENIIRHFKSSPVARVTWVLCNNPGAYVLTRAAGHGVNTRVFARDEFYGESDFLGFLTACNPSLIVLAGFLWLVPTNIISSFNGRIINIHPALLPKYGGKGMYGINVHRTVIENRDKESGITIHRVNEKYDEGQVIFQARCQVLPDDTPESLAARIQSLEHEHFPRVLEALL